MDALTIEAELASAAAPSSPVGMADDLREHVKAMIGLSCEVVLKAPGEIPRSQGKAVRVKDLRQANMQ